MIAKILRIVSIGAVVVLTSNTSFSAQEANPVVANPAPALAPTPAPVVTPQSSAPVAPPTVSAPADMPSAVSSGALSATDVPATAPVPEAADSGAKSSQPQVVTEVPISAGPGVSTEQPPIVVAPMPTIPAADNSLFDKATRAINANNVDDFVSMFDSSNFVFITPKADRVVNLPELKVQWGSIFGATGMLKESKASFTPAKMIDLAPGAVGYDGSLVFVTVDGKTIRGVISGSMKYVDDAWKIATMNFSAPDLIRLQVEQENTSKKGSGGNVFMFLIGLVLGLGIMFYVHRQKQAHITSQQ